MILLLSGHSGDVYSVALSADGKKIVSGSWDRTVKIWDTDSGEVIHTLSGDRYELKIIEIKI